MRITDLEYAMLCLFNEYLSSDNSDEYKIAIVMSLKPEWREKIHWKFWEIMFNELQYQPGEVEKFSDEQFIKYFYEAQSKFDPNKVLESLFQKIEEFWDVTLSEAHTNELRKHLINTYGFATVFDENKNARLSDYVKKVSRLSKKGDQLLKALEAFEKEAILPPINILNKAKYLKHQIKSIKDKDSPLNNMLYVAKLITDTVNNRKELDYQLSIPKNMIRTLGLLYQDITGERPTITYNNYTEEYSGKFLMFCNLLNQDMIWSNDQIAYLTKKFFPPPPPEQ